MRFAFPLLLAPLLLASCTRPQPAKESGLKQVALTKAAFPADDLGRPIALKAPAKRVVVIGPGAVETMFALGAASQLVGRDDYADFPAQAKRVAIAGNYQGPNIEACLALRPDLVVVAQETSSRAKFDDWQQKLGVPVAALTATKLLALSKDIEKLGAWVGKSNSAPTVASTLGAAPPDTTRAPRALIQTGDSPGWIAGSGTLVSDAARYAGLRNIADELKIVGYQQINIESLLVKQPDVLIVPSKKPRAQILASLRASGPFSKLKCVRQGRVLVVDGDLLLRPGPRLLEGVKALKNQEERRNTP